MDIIRKHLTDAEAEEWVAKMEKMRQEFPEEEFEAPTLSLLVKEELRGSRRYPGFDDVGRTTGPAGTEIVPVRMYAYWESQEDPQEQEFSILILSF